MQALHFIAFTVLVGAVVLVEAAPGDSDPACLGTPLTMTEELKKIRDECHSKYNDTYDPRGRESKNITCIWVCFLKGCGLMSADNKFLKGPLPDIFKKTGFPEQAIAPFVKDVGTCIDTKGSTFEIKNGSCESLNTIYECAGRAFLKTCPQKDEHVTDLDG